MRDPECSPRPSRTSRSVKLGNEKIAQHVSLWAIIDPLRTALRGGELIASMDR